MLFAPLSVLTKGIAKRLRFLFVVYECFWCFGMRVMFFFFSSRRRHTRYWRDWSSDVCSSDLLAETPEGGGTMLDNSVVLTCNFMADIHRIRGLPFVTIGSCGGYFKTGRYLRFGGWANPPAGKKIWDSKGVAHNGLLTAIANAMGVPMAGFGDPKYAGELPGVRG